MKTLNCNELLLSKSYQLISWLSWLQKINSFLKSLLKSSLRSHISFLHDYKNFKTLLIILICFCHEYDYCSTTIWTLHRKTCECLLRHRSFFKRGGERNSLFFKLIPLVLSTEKFLLLCCSASPCLLRLLWDGIGRLFKDLFPDFLLS